MCEFDTSTPIALRNQSLIGFMVHTSGTVIRMWVKYVYVQGLAPGCAFTNKAASVTKCPFTTILR